MTHPTLPKGLFVLLLLSFLPGTSFADDATQAKILERLDRLEKKQADLEEQLKSKDARIKELETELNRVKQETKEKETRVTTKEGAKGAPPPVTATPEVEKAGAEIGSIKHIPETERGSMMPPPAEEKPKPPPWKYEPGKGFRVFNNEWGEMNVSIYSYGRFLEQKGTDDTYTDSFGRTTDIFPREDLQLAKLQFKFAGWLGTPKFRYYLWAWTSNANMGQGAQVVLGGTLSYLLNKHFNFGGGITALPTTRSTHGTFPYWLRVDARPIADEFFRGSYTTAVFAYGDIVKGFHYKTMLGNNLSQLGIDASQLGNAFQTVSTALWWTTDNYGAYEGLGDFDKHNKVALTFGGAYTFSPEDKQSQPNKEGFENTQIRLSDGTAIFDPNAFGPGLQVDKATYQMSAFDGGVKYKGFSFDFDYYFRWVNSLVSQETLPVKSLFDHGVDAQASYMLVNRLLQAYVFGSKIFGQYGRPYEIGGGLNLFPLKNKAARLNLELSYVHHSPVGYLAYPYQVGTTGPVFMANFELNL